MNQHDALQKGKQSWITWSILQGQLGLSAASIVLLTIYFEICSSYIQMQEDK